MPMPEQSEEQPTESAQPKPKKRKRSRHEESGQRRCTNAYCHIEEPPVRAVGPTIQNEHVSSLENRIRHLEQELLRTRSGDHGLIEHPPNNASQERNTSTASFNTTNHFSERELATNQHVSRERMRSPPSAISIIVNVQHSQSHKFPVLEPEVGTSSPILIYGAHAPTLSLIHPPEEGLAERIVETAYSYVQARYCIIDWVQLREWHRQRDSYLNSTQESDVQSQTAAFFIWMIYAIGARFVPELGQESSEAYFARASKYLPIVIGLQDIFTVQALLCMIQYCFRAPKGPSLWDLTRTVMNLCIKLRYHRSLRNMKSMEKLDPLAIELRKRFWWCAYCFDRCVSMLSKLPFSIRDTDIDVEEPVNIDDACTDHVLIQDMQQRQANGGSAAATSVTTMSSALQHLKIYRIRSAITSRFMGPSAEVPSYSDVQTFLAELNEWKDQFPKRGESPWSPQQPPDRVQATYLQAVLVLIRPVLLQADLDPPLLSLCASFAAEACESGRTLSLDSQTFPDRITVFHCFFCGVTLLQCLAVDPKALPRRRTHQAISSCLSSLTVYSRALPAVTPFLHLYDELANCFFGNEDDETPPGPNPDLRKLLKQVVLSDPSETPELLRSLRPCTTERTEAAEGQIQDESRTLSRAGGSGQSLPANTLPHTPQEEVGFLEGNPHQFGMFDLDLPDLDNLLYDITNPDVSSLWSSTWPDSWSVM
ncbi:hypothetical protein M409DRAFT_21945 [Zasmidium cellare ATCC 36951]|uniref:Xylanolytic transcriptional activator regulatory domain-containing protein n=1 Tax=Zasmidium cellare ATCC 36951 TaxID=1080233 RepID=A0A6A6CKX2_ZASCE|nr:uncharacterized protein M409DRAFT_21945 [Zasmidium cellare ATCC 36951]KAF2167795.1 hypothetical protein M409DRAFT_21945 [Zasmidium cellare ATCC 36951]